MAPEAWQTAGMAYDGSGVPPNPGLVWGAMRAALPAAVAQWVRFAVVGAGNTVLSWCVYALLFGAGVHYLLASGLAFAVGATNSYVLNRRWTFASGDRAAPEVLRFGVVQSVGLALNLCVLYALVREAEVHHLVAQLIGFPVASVVTFLLSRHWAFAGAKRARA
jgi:putative flippase GtrA